MAFTPGTMPSVCAECGAAIPQGTAWVRSGKLLCATCDFAHKSSGHAVAVAKHKRAAAKSSTPRRRGIFFKPQYYAATRGVLAWVDVQRQCDTEAEALQVARTEAPRGASQVRAMRVDGDANTRAPLAAQPR